MTTAPLIEEVARTAYGFNAAFRREHGLSARTFDELSERSQEYYLALAGTIVAAVGPQMFGRSSIAETGDHLTSQVFRFRSTRWTRLQAAVRGWWARNVAAEGPDDPSPFDPRLWR